MKSKTTQPTLIESQYNSELVKQSLVVYELPSDSLKQFNLEN